MSHCPASPHFQARPPIVQYEIVFLAQPAREAEVGLELSLSPITILVEVSLSTIASVGKIVWDWVDGDLSEGNIIVVQEYNLISNEAID